MGRVDLELVARGLAASRSAAQRLIADRAVFAAGGTPVARASMQVGPHDALRVAESAETRYVSRAGAKLEGALRRAGWSVAGLDVLDVGMSTGGFADCLLQAGAARVVGIEVGHGQLHPRLRNDPRVRCFERTNVRDVTPETLGDAAPAGGFARAVADVSFISLTLVIAAIDRLLAPGARALLLVKPQFELTRDALDGRGVVTREADREAALASVAGACRSAGWSVLDAFDSGVPGGDGNLEYFLSIQKP